jgi:hypothetical protein
MNAKEAHNLAEKRNDLQANAKQVSRLLSYCHDEIKSAAEIGLFSVLSPLNGPLRDCSRSVIRAVEERLRNDGFGIGCSGNQDYIYW